MKNTMSKIDSFPSFHPLSRQEWRDWLKQNCDSSEGIWFVYFKKATGKPRVSYDDAVEEALCFGWIDSVPRKLDDERSSLLFTPRKRKSVWSKLNKTRIEKLIESKEMTSIGLAKIEAAKKDGSWDTLNSSDNMEIPKDLATAFSANKSAKDNFEAFSDSTKRAILFWVGNAKREETRNARIEKTVSMAAQNKRVNFDKE